MTNAAGRYDFAGMLPGTYTIRASKFGFADVTQTNEIVTDVVVNFDLQPGVSGVEQPTNRCQALGCRRRL